MTAYRIAPCAALAPALATLLGALAGVPPAWAASSSAPTSSAAAPVETGVRVTQAWIRWLPARLPAGGYLTLVNDRNQPVTLAAASSVDYASVALHRTLSAGGTTRMVAVAAITVRAHATLAFAALGYHLMLQRPRVPIGPGQQVPLTLQFSDGGALRILVRVHSPSATRGEGEDMSTMPGMQQVPHRSH
jgi:periplasmic copper chaperone A